MRLHLYLDIFKFYEHWQLVKPETYAHNNCTKGLKYLIPNKISVKLCLKSAL